MSELGSVNIGSLRPLSAACCSIVSCYTDFPSCIGCEAEEEVCCVGTSSKGCKPISEENEDNKCCILCEGMYFCKKPSTVSVFRSSLSRRDALPVCA